MVRASELGSRWLKYHEKTDEVIEWLITTAYQSCGNFAGIALSSSTRRAIEAAVRDDRVQMEVKDLIVLAERTRDAENRASIPRNIIYAAEDAIALRQEHHDTIAAKSIRESGSKSQKDLDHEYFIGVLVDVLRVLRYTRKTEKKSAMAVESEREDRTPQQARSASCARPKFAEYGHSPSPDRSPIPARDVELPPWKFALKEQNSDGNFVLWCHLQDMIDVRFFVKDVWKRYRRGGMSFLLASMVTNAAFCLLKCADDGLTALDPDLKKFSTMLTRLELKAAYDSQMGAKVRITSTTSGVVVDDVDTLDRLCVDAFLALRVHIRQIGYVLAKRHRSEGESLADVPEPPECLQNELSALLTRNAMSIVTHQESSGAEMSIDGFMNAMGDYTSPCDHQRIWLVHAVQTQGDVLDILRAKRSQGLFDLTQAIEQCQAAVDAKKIHNETMPGAEDDPMSDWLQRTTKTLLEAKTLLLTDTSTFDRGDVDSTSYEMQREIKLGEMGKNPWISGLETEFPTQAGSSLYTLKSSMAFVGCHVANDEAAVHCMAYLYTAARHTNLLANPWPDMEWFVESQKSVGPPVPASETLKEPFDIFIAFNKAVGCNGNAKKVRKGKVEFRMKNGKKIKTGAPLTAKLLIGFGASESTPSQVSPDKMLEVVLQQLAVERNEKSGATRYPTKPTPVELLGAYETLFTKEEIALNFDYFGFWMVCFKILGEIVAAVGGSCTVVRETYDILSEDAFLMNKMEGSKLEKATRPLRSYISGSGSEFWVEAQKNSTSTMFGPVPPPELVKERERMDLY